MDEKLNEKIGLLIEYYSDPCQTEDVIKIIQEMQNLYDFEEETEEKLKPLLKELYKKVIKREFHSDLLKEVLEEI